MVLRPIASAMALRLRLRLRLRTWVSLRVRMQLRVRQHRRPERVRRRIGRAEIRAEDLRVLGLRANVRLARRAGAAGARIGRERLEGLSWGARVGLFGGEAGLLLWGGQRARGGGRGGCAGHVFHGGADDGLEGVAVLLHAGRALGHDEEGGGAGAEVVGDGECPEGGREEEAVAGWR